MAVTEELTSRMAVLVEFLGAVLGQDYEVALYDLDTEGYPVVAIANGRISGQTIGSPLPEAAREKLRQAGQPQPGLMGLSSAAYFSLRMFTVPSQVKSLPWRPFREGITQSKKSTPRATASRRLLGVPTPIR